MVLLIMLVLWKNGNEQNARVEFAGAKFLSNGLRNPRKCPRHFVLKDLKNSSPSFHNENGKSFV
jgi:hypothetical protein